MCKNIEVGDITLECVFEESSSADSIDRSVALVSRVGSARIDPWPRHAALDPSAAHSFPPFALRGRARSSSSSGGGSNVKARAKCVGCLGKVSSSGMHHAKLPGASFPRKLADIVARSAKDRDPAIIIAIFR